MSVMLKVRCLDSVHASEHQDAERIKEQIMSRARNAERVMLRAMRLPQAGQKEIEGRDSPEEEVSAAVKQ
jgi:hypothetical protein